MTAGNYFHENGKRSWKSCRNILCVRTDNAGDLLMSVPAIRALKNSFSCKITVLTSPMGAEMAAFIPEIDYTISFNSPWNRLDALAESSLRLIARLREESYDAVVIFTVYSQNPLPAAYLAFLAGIPRRLAYCRENPYELLTHWIPDEEPLFHIKHQVKRDLDLVAAVGATSLTDDTLRIFYSGNSWQRLRKIMISEGINLYRPWILLHPGVSEKKREYPEAQWVRAGKLLHERTNVQLLVTGNAGQREMTTRISRAIGFESFSLAGMLSFDELIALIDHAPLLISVNTVVPHIAAATRTPVIVLYALTNPQHTPWKVMSRVLVFHPQEDQLSLNTVVRFVYQKLLKGVMDEATPEKIVQAAEEMMLQTHVQH